MIKLSTKISGDELESVIGDYLTEYTQEVKDKVKKLTEEVSEEAIEELKSTSPKKVVSMQEHGKGKKKVIKLLFIIPRVSLLTY